MTAERGTIDFRVPINDEEIDSAVDFKRSPVAETLNNPVNLGESIDR